MSGRFGKIAMDAGKITHTVGRRIAEGNKKAEENKNIPKEEWQQRHADAKKKHSQALEEGERRKDSKGAYPKDVIKKMNSAQKEIDLARQHGGHESGSGEGQKHDPDTGRFT